MALVGVMDDPDRLRPDLLVPYEGAMTYWPVSQRVGNVKTNDPSLTERVNL